MKEEETRMSKRIMSVILSVLLLFTFAMPSMAAGLSDVDGTKYAGAVERLNALNIMTGYPDGTFGVEKNITRAEFSTLAIRALGLESTAKSSAGNTKFKDVDATHWASGYINLAATKGIIKGYPDGTFKPEANVTYAEAVTMLVRVLGYEPAVEGTDWPSNYLAKAAEIGFTKSLDFSASSPANRGDIAVLLDNSLESDLMEQVGYGTDTRWEEQPGKTLLTEYLNLHKLENAIVSMTAGFSQDKLNANEVEITDEKGIKHTFDLKDGVSLDNLLGHEVTAYVIDADNDGIVEDDEILTFVVDTTNSKDVIAYDYIVGIGKDTSTTHTSEYYLADGGMTVSLDATNDTFNFADNAVVYYNHEKIDDLTNMAADKVGVGFTTLGEVAGTFILNDNNDVIFMNVFNYDDPLVITNVDVANEKVSYFKNDIDKEASLVLDGETYTIYKNGKLASLSDLAVNDVLYSWKLTDGSYVLEAYDYKISGTLESVYSDGNNYWDYVLVVDGKKIYVGPNFTYSLDDNDTTDLLATGLVNTSADYGNAVVPSDKLKDLEDLVGSQVTVYIGKYYEGTEGWNYGRHLVSNIDATNSYYMVSDDAWSVLTTGMKYYIELINSSNNEVVYELTENDTEFNGTVYDLATPDGYKAVFDKTGSAYFPVGTLVDVRFNSDGTISTIKKVQDIVEKPVTAINSDYDRLQIDGTWYSVTDKTVFYDAYGMEVTDWVSIEDVNLATLPLTVSASVNNSYELDAVVVYNNSQNIGSNDYGLVLKRSITSGGLVVTMAVDGVVKDYDASDLNTTDQGRLLEGTLVKFTASANVLDAITVEDKYSNALTLTNPEKLSSAEFNQAYITVTGQTYGVEKVTTDTYTDLYLNVDNTSVGSESDIKVGRWTTADGKFTPETGYSVNFALSKFEIVSGGVDSKNGVIEVVAYGGDEYVDRTYYINVDQYGVDSFFYDVDSSWLSGKKVLALSDLTNGDIINAYDVNNDGIFDYIVVVDR